MLVSRSELSYYPEPQLEKQEEVRNYRKKPNKKVRKNNSSLKLLYILVSIIILGTCIFILSRYAAITSIRTEITNLEREKLELEKIKMDLAAELDSIKSSNWVAEDAVVKLGMGHPTEDQIAYISVKESNITIESEKLSMQKHMHNIFKKVISLF